MGGVGGGRLARAHLLEVRLRGFGRAEDGVAHHLIELGVVWVSHPNKPALAGVDTCDGAHLYPAPVWDVGGDSQEGIEGFPPTSSFFAAPASAPTHSAFFARPFAFGAGTAFDFWGGFLIRGAGGAFFAGGRRRGRGGVVGFIFRVRLEPLPLLCKGEGEALPPSPLCGGGGGGGLGLEGGGG